MFFLSSIGLIEEFTWRFPSSELINATNIYFQYWLNSNVETTFFPLLAMLKA
jgi:hypothetical protein